MRAIFLTVGLVVCAVASSYAGVTVNSPGNGVSIASPVHFVASSTTTCSKGVAAMGIYTAPSVLAYVVKAAKLDTNLVLSAGTYHAVIQSWDNCGGASTSPLTLTVINGNVQVTAPADNASISGPVHFVATASTSCSSGVAAMGIYSGPNQLAYKTSGAALDTNLNLASRNLQRGCSVMGQLRRSRHAPNRFYSYKRYPSGREGNFAGGECDGVFARSLRSDRYHRVL